ncbi:hypothetical protein ACFR9U_11695 [Halorientalis brevis]|uniref:Uncharacterized protein n=1 Tax=Halorientalis brevis TaxID=1126241 RepID=A0ABD6CDJ7_9EURY
MNQLVRVRLVVLVGLVVIGIGLAGVGVAFGVTKPIADAGSSGEFVVSEENVTFSAGGESTVVVDNVSDVREISIEETDTGHFTLRTTDDQALTETERQRAREIAVANDTVQRELDALAAYELTVKPIQKLNVSSVSQRRYTTVVEINQTGDEFTVRETALERNDSGTVTIERDPTYVEDRASVRIRQPGVDDSRELKYTVTVDLANGSVTDVTDWETTRRNAASATVTRTSNVTDVAIRTP